MRVAGSHRHGMRGAHGRRNRALAALAALTLAACSSGGGVPGLTGIGAAGPLPYQASNAIAPSGYSESIIGPDRYRIEVPSSVRAALESVGVDLARRLREAMDVPVERIEGYGKGPIVGAAGELEHGALWHVPGGYAMRERLGASKAIVPSAMKLGAFGASLDVPLGHANAAYVRSHFDAITVSDPEGPRPDEILFAPVMRLGYRLDPPDPDPDRQGRLEEEGRAADTAILAHYAELQRRLAGRNYFCGDFSVADIGLFMTVLFVLRRKGPRLDGHPELAAWYARVGARAAVAPVAAEIAAADRELAR